jgi:hypothetical protein
MPVVYLITSDFSEKYSFTLDDGYKSEATRCIIVAISSYSIHLGVLLIDIFSSAL